MNPGSNPGSPARFRRSPAGSPAPPDRFRAWHHGRSPSSPRAPTGRRTTASGSATCFAGGATGSCSSPRSRSRGRSRRRGSRSASCAWRRPPRARRTRGSSGRTSSATRRRSSASRRSSSSRASSRRRSRRSCDGARYVRRAAGGDHRGGRARRHRRGQRRLVSRRCPASGGRGRGSSPATRPRSRTPRCRRRSRATRSPTEREWDAYRAEYARTLGPLHAAFSEFCRERGRPAARRGRAHPHLAGPEPLALSRTRSTTRARDPLGDAWHNLRGERARRPTPPGSCPSRWPPATARSSTSASARSAPPTSS